jgi:hypothetical protein
MPGEFQIDRLYPELPFGFRIAAPMNIKEIIKDNEVHFVRYRQGFAYYSVQVPAEDARYVFPVPLSDIGDATLLARDKAIIFMRYIRAAIAEGTFLRGTAG